MSLNLLALGHGNMDDILAFVAGQQMAVVGVCAPKQVNQGLMANPEVRKNLYASPSSRALGEFPPGRLSNSPAQYHHSTNPRE